MSALDHLSAITTLFHHPERLGRLVRSGALDPFRFQTQRCGLVLGAGCLTLAVAGRYRNKSRIIDTVSVPVEDPMDASLAAALARLRQARPEHLPAVILSVDSTVLSYQLLMPEETQATDLAAFVVESAPRLLPAGLPLTEVALDFRPVQTGDGMAAQVVWARRERLERLVGLVERAGFQVAGMYPRGLALIEHHLRTDSADALILWASDAITYAPCAGGLAQHLHEAAWTSPEGGADLSDLAERVTQLLAQPSSQIHIVGSSMSEKAMPPVERFAEALERQGTHATIVSGPDEAVAAALAGVHPSRTPFQPLADRPVAWAQQEQDRRWGLRIAWGGGVLVAALLVIGTILGWYYGYEQRILTRELTAKGAWIAEVRTLSERERTLFEDVAALRSLQAGRAGVAKLLETLGRALPDGVWLRTLRLTRQEETGAYEAHLSGLARAESRLAVFFSRLHEAPAWRPKDAFTTTRLDPATVQRQAGVRLPLIRFELTLMAQEP